MGIFGRKPVSRTLTGARASLTTTHFMQVKPEPHEHTWNVTVWTECSGDVRHVEKELIEELGRIGRQMLNVTIPSGSAEDLARHLQRALHGICKVEIEREGRYLASHEGEPVDHYSFWSAR